MTMPPEDFEAALRELQELGDAYEFPELGRDATDTMEATEAFEAYIAHEMTYEDLNDWLGDHEEYSWADFRDWYGTS